MDGTSIHPGKPLIGFSLINVTGSCTKGIYLANIRNAEIRNVHVTGYAGPHINIKNVTGIGLNSSAKIDSPKIEDAIPISAEPYRLH